MVSRLDIPKEAFDFERTDWPERAKVRATAPIGLGTPGVESLSGYALRTAIESRLSLRRFLERVIAEAVGDSRPGLSIDQIAALSRSVMGNRGAAINGAWKLARSWTMILEEATLQTRLEELTVTGWSDRLSTRELLRDDRAFCPACLWDWTEANRPRYEPLRWQFQALTVCVVHDLRLREACATPDCGRTRGVASGWASIDRCVGCRRPFAQEEAEARLADGPVDPEELDWNRFVDQQLGELVATPPAQGEMGPYRFPEILAIAIESVGGIQRTFAERIGMTEAVVSYWKDDRRRPSMIALLRVCRVAGFRLRDVLLGNVTALQAAPAPVQPLYVAPSVEHHRVLDQDQMKRILDEALVAEPPPTLAALWRDPRLVHRNVRRRFPQLCAAIRERRADYDLAGRQARLATRATELVADIRKLHDYGIYPSRNQLCKRSPMAFRLIDRDLNDIWRNELIRLGWGDPSRLRRQKGDPTPAPLRTEAVPPA